MAPVDFARYLFGLWAYDLILAARAAQVFLALAPSWLERAGASTSA